MLRKLLTQFGLDNDTHFARLSVRMPPDTVYTQPDVCLESNTARVFIEVKVGKNTLNLEQVQKYLLLHADQDMQHGVRRPYLLFLTNTGLPNCWKPSAQATGEVHKFLHKAITKEVIYGATTWQSIGQCLVDVYRHSSDPRDEYPMPFDFVSELRRRKLLL
jgi:hypothetical protein